MSRRGPKRRTPEARKLRAQIANAKRFVSINEANGHGRVNGINKLKREYVAIAGRRK